MTALTGVFSRTTRRKRILNCFVGRPIHSTVVRKDEDPAPFCVPRPRTSRVAAALSCLRILTQCSFDWLPPLSAPANSARMPLPQKPFSFGARRFIRVSATTAKICAAARSTYDYSHASTRAARPPTVRASVRALSPSIFRAAEFGGYVVTRFLPGDDFHAYRPTVHIRPRLS